MATGLSDVLSTHVINQRFEDLPVSTVAAAKRAILDGLGVMLAASGLSADTDPFVTLACRAGGASQATLLGRRVKVPMAMAAFANGALSHALDFEDAFDAAPTHPNASLLPAALAVCEGAGPVAGRDLLTAVAVGCDLVCRLALSVRRPLEAGGWYPPPIFGAFGAVAAAARLLRLSPVQLRDAFSLLMCQNVCPGEIKYSSDTVIRAVREAFPAQAAVTAALLAREGLRGFEQPFEGRSGFFALFADGQYDPEVLRKELGRHFWIEQLSFKQWPCCRGTHAFIEAAYAIREQESVEPDDIKKITLLGDDVLRMLCEPAAQKLAPQNIIEAKFSLPFMVALAFTRPDVKLDSVTSATLRDVELQNLAGRCRFLCDPRFKGHAAAGGLLVKLRSGRTLQHAISEARGSPSRPLTEAQLHAKFLDCLSHTRTPIESEAARACLERLCRLQDETDVGAILASL